MSAHSLVTLRMVVCVRPLSCKTARATPAALTRRIHPARVGGHGATLRLRLGPRVYALVGWPQHLFILQLLDASAAEAAWNFCAPVTDYDGLRKEVAAIFADKVVEVQGLVAKLQKTQRAAEQALDKCVLTSV